MIGTLGELYLGKAKYGMTDAEIFENLDNNNNNHNNDDLDSLGSFTDRDFMDAGELEEELVGGVV